MGGAVRLDDFRQLVQGLVKDVPEPYLDGVVEVEVSPKTVPHPLRADVYTLGECIPLDWSGSGADLQSRIVLYHGSFAALARLGDFDWRKEAWETVTHELRHHLEWRARTDRLEAYDRAADENFKRHEGQPFDPLFYRSGEEVAPHIYKVDDDIFVERAAGNRQRGGGMEEVVWHGRPYRVQIPGGVQPPVFLVLEGLSDPPPGDAVLVIPRRASLLDFWRRPKVTEASVRAQALDG